MEIIVFYLQEMQKRKMNKQEIGGMSPAALHALVVKSQGGKFGARDLRRVIRKAVEDPAAEKIIDGTLASGSSLTVDAENDEIVLR